jgi:hypothetical protein
LGALLAGLWPVLVVAGVVVVIVCYVRTRKAAA